METLKIKKDDALKAFEQGSRKEKDFLNNLFGEKTFQRNVMERIKTMEDVLLDNEFDHDSFLNKYCPGLTDDEIAYKQIKLITKSLNEGWEPDWTNSSEGKYYPWFDLSEGSSGFRCYDFGRWGTLSDVGSRLCFKSKELAEYAGKQFTDVYNKFMTIK
jgi:hypothetical protein